MRERGSALASPEAEDLVGVEATDERHATVRTAAGASYQTTDAGRTWNEALDSRL